MQVFYFWVYLSFIAVLHCIILPLNIQELVMFSSMRGPLPVTATKHIAEPIFRGFFSHFTAVLQLAQQFPLTAIPCNLEKSKLVPLVFLENKCQWVCLPNTRPVSVQPSLRYQDYFSSAHFFL